MSIEEIRAKWQIGDAKTISQMTELTQDYIRRVIAGERNSDVVIKAAIKVIEARESLIGQSK
jgi:hypothetical protein